MRFALNMSICSALPKAIPGKAKVWINFPGFLGGDKSCLDGGNSAVATGFYGQPKKGFLVERSGGVFLLLDLVGFLR